MDKYTAGFSFLSAAALATAITIGIYSDETGEYEVEMRMSALDTNEPLLSYFVIDKKTGEKCNCGTVANLRKVKDDTSYTKCATICKKVFEGSETRCAMCADGLCRYGKSSILRTEAGEPENCDPDAAGCVPWPCVVPLGVEPAMISRNPELDKDGVAVKRR